MIAPALKRRPHHLAEQHREHFLLLLPAIVKQARYAFRNEPPDRRQELVAEVVANAFVAFARLVQRGLMSIIYATPLAQYAIKQVRDGRRVGCKLNVRDVSSEYAQQIKRFKVERLDHYDTEKGEWREVVVEDRHAGPAESRDAPGRQLIGQIRLRRAKFRRLLRLHPVVGRADGIFAYPVGEQGARVPHPGKRQPERLGLVRQVEDQYREVALGATQGGGDDPIIAALHVQDAGVLGREA